MSFPPIPIVQKKKGKGKGNPSYNQKSREMTDLSLCFICEPLHVDGGISHQIHSPCKSKS